jgi:hypothetical protein
MRQRQPLLPLQLLLLWRWGCRGPRLPSLPGTLLQDGG